jgi:superfamily I DNA and/or RNA helicase
MNQRIMALSNELVYQGKLELASEAVKKKSLVLRKDWE